MFQNLKDELDSIRERDPAARTRLEVFLLYSGFRAVCLYRVAHWFQQRNMKLIARYISQRARHKTGVEIHPAAKIGKGLFIDHGMGVVIGETAEIGDYCTLYQGVTLGGTGKDQGKRHPTLGNHVMVGSGAKILGPFKVGDNARVAAGAVVLSEVPSGATAVGVPARIVRINGERPYDLDQINVSDPVEQEMNDLQNVCTALSMQLEVLMERLEFYQKERENKRDSQKE
jgi:serine O-acetyltransferase